MIEITIAQAIISALALIVATIIIAQPFRKKVKHVHNQINLNKYELEDLVQKIFTALAESIAGKFAPIVAEYEALKAEKEAAKPKARKSRAGEIRKPSTLPKNASEEEKRKLKNRLRSRAYRAKKRAELNK